MAIYKHDRTGIGRHLAIATLLGVGLLAGGCDTLPHGGESGGKYGPYNKNPNAKPGPGKFKSNCRVMTYLPDPSDPLLLEEPLLPPPWIVLENEAKDGTEPGTIVVGGGDKGERPDWPCR